TMPAPTAVPKAAPTTVPKPAPTAWAPTTEPAALYHRLAELSARRGEASLRDRYLALAADAAFSCGRPDEAERLRKPLIAATPQHALASFPPFEAAPRAGHVQAYLRSLRQTNPPEEARKLLDETPEPDEAHVPDAIAAPNPIDPIEAQKRRDEVVHGIV